MPAYMIVILLMAILSSGIFTALSFKKTFFNMLLKTFSSMLFTALGLFALFNLVTENVIITADNRLIGGFMMFFALVICMIGDIILGLPKLSEQNKNSNIVFVTGASWFGLGHLVYCIALILIFGISPWVLLIVIPLSIFYTFGNKLFGKMNYGNLTLGIVAYSLLEGLSFALCIIPLVREYSTCALLLSIGFSLFYFSDMVLMHNYFAKKKRINSILCHATYYPAQILIALSIMFIPL